MTPTRETIARALAPIAWAALGLADTLAQKNRRTASLRHADAVLRALDAAGLAVVPKRTGGLDDVLFFVRSALSGFETLQPDDAIENATWDLREVLSIMSAMIAVAPSTAPDVVG